MPEIIINGQTLTYNNIIYVSTTGDDINGDGSEKNPFASVDVAITNAVSGDGICIEKGHYILNKMPVNDYHEAGLYLQNKDIDIFSKDGHDTILEWDGTNSTKRDGMLFYGVGINSKIFNLTFYFYPKEASAVQYECTTNAIFTWCSGEFHNIFIKTMGTNEASWLYYNTDPGDLKIYNSLFYFPTGNVRNSYSGTATWINCLSNVAFGPGTTTTCLVKNFNPDDLYLLEGDSDLYNTGTGVDSFDGSQANIGLFGGVYPWSPTQYFLINDNGNIKTYDYDANSWVLVTTAGNETDLTYQEYGISSINIPLEKFQELSSNIELLLWTKNSNKTTATVNIKGQINKFTELNSNNVKLLVWANDLNYNKEINLDYIPKAQLILPKDDIKLNNIAKIKNINLVSNVIKYGILKIIFSIDKGLTWNSYNSSLGLIDVNINDLLDVKTNGMSPEQLSSITEAEWESIIGETISIRFGYYLEISNTTDKSETDQLDIYVDLKGVFKKAYSNSYDYIYSNNNVIVNLLTDGTYKINY